MKNKLISLIIFISLAMFSYGQSISVDMPGGGELVKIGQNFNVAWTSTGISSGTVRIALRKQDGSGGYVLADNVPYNSLPQIYTVADDVDPGNYFVRVRQGTVDGESRIFHISALPIDVTHPRVNSALVSGISYNIRWDLGGHMPGACFKVVLFRGNTMVMNIQTNHCGREYSWQVPVLESAPNYMIRVLSTDKRAMGDSGRFLVKTTKPDLIITSMDVVFNPPGSQKQITFKAKIENDSLGLAQASLAKLEISGPGGYRQVFDNLPVRKLNFGAHDNIEQSYTLPRSGIYENKLTLDKGHSVDEANENNNVKIKPYRTYGLPDLVVCYRKKVQVLIQVAALSVKNYNSGIEVFVKNNGEKPSPPSRLRFWIKKKGVKHYNIPVLAPGQQHRVFRGQKWHIAGTSQFSLKIDDNFQVMESFEDNNSGAGTIKKSMKFGLQAPLECSGPPVAQMRRKRK